MTRLLIFLILFATTALTSCDTQNDLPMPNETSNLTFNISVRIPNTSNPTRLASITRYIVEIYKTSEPTILVQRVEQTSGTIILTLDANVNYTFLFWADGVAPNDNTNGTYNASSLKNVTLNTGKEMSEAFFARLDITNTIPSYNVTLKRATAQVNLVETGIITASTNLTVTYDRYLSFNTFTSEAIGVKTLTTQHFNSTATTGTRGTFLTFASVASILTDFTISSSSTTTIHSLYNIPLKANFITNIHGEYDIKYYDFSIVVTIDHNWENEVDGIEINVGTTESPKWIKVANRNADKNGPYSGAVGSTATDYGYYYQWSNADNDANNVEKAYNACYTFGEGGGTWRLPTQAEMLVILGGGYSDSNETRKLKWDNTTWKLFDERVGQTSKFVYFPLAGFRYGNSNDISNIGDYGFYWTSTHFEHIAGDAWYLFFDNVGGSFMTSNSGLHGFPVRCVRNV